MIQVEFQVYKGVCVGFVNICLCEMALVLEFVQFSTVEIPIKRQLLNCCFSM